MTSGRRQTRNAGPDSSIRPLAGADSGEEFLWHVATVVSSSSKSDILLYTPQSHDSEVCDTCSDWEALGRGVHCCKTCAEILASKSQSRRP